MTTTTSSNLADGPRAVADRLADVRGRIAGAAEAAGRDASEVGVVAVCKRQPLAAVRAAFEAGQIVFGESRPRDLRDRSLQLPDAAWHLVGRLQTNKVKHVVGCALVHSVDRDDLVDALARRADHDDVDQDVLVQVNVDGDPAKAGYPPDRVAAALDRVRRAGRLRAVGLMTMPALHADPRPAYARLRELRDHHAASSPDLVHLSMGMSSDLEAAVGEGATLVRPGEAVFGPRPT